MSDDKLKKCPECAEEIKSEALVCKHCGYKFNSSYEKVKSWITIIVFGFLIYFLFFYEFKEEKKESKTPDFNITEKQKQNMLNRWGDPGYVDSKWEGNEFVLYLKSPPPKDKFLNYANTVCIIADKDYELKKFKLKIMKLNTNEVTGRTTCNR